MPRAHRLPRLLLAVAGCAALSAHALAGDIDPHTRTGLLFEAPLPGGVRAALDVLNDPRAADRSHFLLDVIRRHHHSVRGSDRRDEAALAALVAHLDRSAVEQGAGRHAPETIPLPLAPDIWLDVVLAGKATEDTLVSAILRSRSAALLYHGLLSLDGETRAWLGARPAMLAEIAAGSAALFATAAPGLRVSEGAVRLPGGTAARPAWEAMVGHPMDDPEAFLRALLGRGQGRLTYLVAAMAQLTDPQIAMAMNLEAADPADRIAATRRLLAIFERLGWDWKVEDRAFWRPPLDPALLVAELATGEDGRPLLPGTRAFWQLAFADLRRGLTRPTSEADAHAAASGPAVDFIWLCEQIFDGSPLGPETRHQLVLFASRVVREVTPGTARDAIDAVRTAGAYPALSTALERAGISDASVFAGAGRRAAQLTGIRQHTRARRALAQFQGALVVLSRAAARSTQPKHAIGRAVASLSAVEPSARGDYDGRLVRWLDAHLRQTVAPDTTPASGAAAGSARHVDGSLDGRLRGALAGTSAAPAAIVDWEGTRYRVDLPHAELIRLDQVLGHGARPYASSALALVRLADALETAPGADALGRHAADLEQIAQAVGWDHRRPSFVEALERRARTGDAGGAARLAPELRLAADDLLGQSLIELAYAAAFGQPERTPISAREAARRHDFGLGARHSRHHSAWQPPVERNDPASGWQVIGSLLGLDVRLAPFSLLQLSSHPPARRPTLNDQDRRTMIETLALIEPAALIDDDRDTIVAAMQHGRARLAALGTRLDALALADEIRMSPARRSLLPWAMVHDPGAVDRFLSAGELLWLGLDRPAISHRLHAWGAPARPRLGCLCLRVVDPRPEEMFSGRWHSGVRISAFPDLSLRLAELLAELGMPAPLLGPVLGPAILDFVNLVVSHDPDDRRGLVEFVQALRIDAVEQYLAALTTDGPLVPLGEAPEPAAASDRRESEVPW